MFDFNKWKSSEKSAFEGTSSGRTKQPLRRLEPSLNRCIQVVIPLHVELLNKHKSNIEKFRLLKEWRNVHREQVNATRTVEQLKSDMWSLDLLRNQLVDDDLAEFDKRTKKMQDSVIEAVQSFIEESGKASEIQTGILSKLEDESLEEKSSGKQFHLSRGFDNEVLQLKSEQILKDDLEKSRHVEASWKQLTLALHDFKEMMDTLAACVHQQQEPINSIEQNLDTAEENITAGRNFLEKAAKYKAVLYPVTGAVLGGCLGGPIGLVVGMKAGAAALVVGGFLGYGGGRFLKTKVGKSAEAEELHCLVETERSPKLNRKMSLPDVSSSGKGTDPS